MPPERNNTIRFTQLPPVSSVNLGDLLPIVDTSIPTFLNKKVSVQDLSNSLPVTTQLKTTSAKYESTYTSFAASSAFYNTAYTNLVTNSAVYLLSGTETYLGDIPLLSGTWTTAYTNLVTNSARYMISGTDVYLGDIPVLSGTWNTAYTNLVSNSAVYLGTTRQYDYVQVGLNSYSYCGYAAPGTLTSGAGWTINRLYFSSAGSLLSSGAVTGVIWNNRYSYTY